MDKSRFWRYPPVPLEAVLEYLEVILLRQAVLVGAPNCGKSSLFRLLTGRSAPIGNRAGVTVEALSAPVVGTDWVLTDLPGLRSLPAASEDEAATVSHLLAAPPDLVLAVCDATALAVGLATLQDLQAALFPAVPTIPVLTLCDELERFPPNDVLHTLTPPCIPVSSRSGQGIDRLRALFDRPIPPSAAVPLSALRAEELTLLVGSPRAGRLRFVRTADRLLLHPLFGIPLFLFLMIGLLWAVFGRFGALLTDGFLSLTLSPLSALTARLPLVGWVRSLLCDGILGGVGAILGFFPRFLLLALLRTLLEQSGYLARAARLFDGFFSRFGLRGDAITPMLLGFGCTVPAILCTRGMRDAYARRRCSQYLPTIACSARMPLCLTVADAFFPRHGWWICALLWVLSGAVFLLLCAADARLCHRCTPPCRHEDPLPLLRLPAPTELLRASCELPAQFLSRTAGTILLTSLGIWLASHFCPGQIGMVATEQSLLAWIGSALSPLLAPMGLADWRLVAALLCGVGAKEAALSTLGVLLGANGSTTGSVGAALRTSGILTPRSALAFLVFYLFYLPCSATLATQKRPRRWFLPLALAYLAAMLVYRI